MQLQLSQHNLSSQTKQSGESKFMWSILNNIFAPNGGYCVYYPSSVFHNMHGFENWGISVR